MCPPQDHTWEHDTLHYVQALRKLSHFSQHMFVAWSNTLTHTRSSFPGQSSCSLFTTPPAHCLLLQVSEKISQYARYLFEEVDNNWSVVHEDGDMKVYRREMEDGGVVVDPLKSFYTASVSVRALLLCVWVCFTSFDICCGRTLR